MSGRIEVITGGMFSGKTEELIRRLRRAEIARKRFLGFKHSSDNRYHPCQLGSHSNVFLEKSQAILSVAGMHELVAASNPQIVGIDEGQFFGEDLVPFCEYMANKGIRVIVAGLDLDSQGKPFQSFVNLMAVAEDVTKLHAVCVQCGEEASRSHYKGSKVHQIEVGADTYEARCRMCWYEQNGEK